MKRTDFKQKTAHWKIGLCTLALPMLAACISAPNQDWLELAPSQAASEDEVLNITGNVQRLGVEGGVFVIRDEHGRQYHPSNLPEAFRVHGLAVQAQAHHSRDRASIGMVGPMVELLRIKRHDDHDQRGWGAQHGHEGQ